MIQRAFVSQITPRLLVQVVGAVSSAPVVDTTGEPFAVNDQVLVETVEGSVYVIAKISTASNAPKWQTIPSLAAGASPGTPSPRYALLSPFNQLVMEGQITASSFTSGVVLFTLPVGFRPNKTHIVTVAWGGTATQSPTVKLDSTGAVTLFCTATTTNIYLDAVRAFLQ